MSPSRLFLKVLACSMLLCLVLRTCPRNALASNLADSSALRIWDQRFTVFESNAYSSISDIPEGVDYVLFLQENTIFPEFQLLGSIRFHNTSSDTLALAEAGASLAKYLKIEYTTPIPDDFYSLYHPDDAKKEQGKDAPLLQYLSKKYAINKIKSAAAKIDFVFLDEEMRPLDMGKYPTQLNRNHLRPNEKEDLLAIVRWNELKDLSPGIKHFRWVFDNSEALKLDPKVQKTRFDGRWYPIEIKAKPEGPTDLLYYLCTKASRLNGTEQFQGALDLCYAILSLDSINIKGLEIATDVLWKMSRFNEAIPYAQKGILLMNQAMRERRLDADWHLKIFNDFLSKCQRREKWKWAK